MTRRKTPSLFWVAASAAVLALAGCARSDRPHAPRYGEDAVWFVHATDPHIFLDTAQTEKTAATGAKQQDLGQTALADMLKRLGSLHDSDAPPAFLVLTGDLGVEPCSIAKSPDSPENCVKTVDNAVRNQQITRTAELLGASPIRDIYLVAGNNDIALEDPADPALSYFNAFIDDVQREIDKNGKNVSLHNLTRCYASTGGPPEGCISDIGHTRYRLIGFPSQSFKNRDGETKPAANAPVQEAQFNKFNDLLKSAQQDGRQVLIVTHTPEMDDPYFLAASRYQAPEKAKDGTVPPSPWVPTWHVSQKLLDGWRDVLANDSVIGVLAGHLHDSHKEIYRQPYAWSSNNDHRMGFRKLFLAPPLSVKNQDASPIQARGFALVRLEDGKLTSRLFWYNAETHEFSPDPEPGLERPPHHGWHLSPALLWLWQLGWPQADLDRMAVLLIAFLAAFLTIVQIQQIPAADNPLTGQEAAPAGGGSGGGTAPARPAFEPSPFASNFGKTVITGLGGLAAEIVLQAFAGQPSAADKEFYIVWFIVFFFLLLILLAFLRAVAEAVRSRLAIRYSPLAREPEPQTRKRCEKQQDGTVKIVEEPQPWYIKFRRWLDYWVLRSILWLFAWRVPLLTFFDTFINLIQGKNQTMTGAFSKTIVDQQRNVVRSADAIRKTSNAVIYSKLSELAPNPRRTPQDVRVNISVLSADQTNVFYISRSPGSSLKSFGKRSVAWVAAFTGRIRWYKKSYSDDQDLFRAIILYDNADGTIAGDEPQIHLNTHYQPRDGDYEAFMMLPVPWPQRGFGSDYVKGTIHISFRSQKDFELLWPAALTPAQQDAQLADAIQKKAAEINNNKSHEKKPNLEEDLKHLKDVQQDIQKIDQGIQAAKNNEERKALREQRGQKMEAAGVDTKSGMCDPVIDNPNYSNDQRALENGCADPEVRATLHEAVTVLSELLHGFNENIYNTRVASNRPD
jgi:hypothetical protein